jgi:hypothetical protein
MIVFLCMHPSRCATILQCLSGCMTFHVDVLLTLCTQCLESSDESVMMNN